MTTHPLFDSKITWRSPHEIAEERIKQLSDEKSYTPNVSPEKSAEIKRLTEEFDRKKFNRRSVAKYARNK